MKKLFSVLAAVLLTANMLAQAPQKMSYQAVIRDADNNLVTSHAVGMRISILQTSSSGTSVYTETQSTTTNVNGLISLEIGAGTVVSGSFVAIDWANGPFFIKTEIDPTGGANYTAIVGTSQLLSVPYALYSGSAANGFSGNYNDLTNKPSMATAATSGFMSASDKAKLNSTDSVVMIHSSLSNAPTTYATIGNLKFRYNSTSINGYIEVEALNSDEKMMVFCDKKYSNWFPGGSGTIENYHNDASYSNSNWEPLISLWDGSGWNDHITMNTYDLFEGTLYNMGNDGNPPANQVFYEFYITIDGYNNVFIKVKYLYN